MKKILLRLGELLCVAALIAFIVFVSSEEKKSDVPIDEVYTSVETLCDLEGLGKGSVTELKKQFALDTESIEDFYYYRSDSVMDVRELLILSLRDITLQESTQEIIRTYANEKKQIFSSYAPREEEMLASHLLVAKNGYILFYVGDNTEAVASEFTKAIS
ncbi:MAG: DUF4358 domain-containing protein [Ruminococcaceae bacterium]|nr:DUF4358 domain-containing protein [Oscillospiraceae bacterium]